MPIYELKCTKCDTEFEFAKYKSDEVAECPTCGMTGEENLEKKISKQTTFSLGGSGWYKDGYAPKRRKS